jgi:3-oxoacyl-[acyl-carrier-protein] synthase II
METQTQNINNSFSTLDNDLLGVINSDENWKKAQAIIQELVGGKLSLIDSNGFIGYENYPDFCHWIRSFPVMMDRCKDCHSQNCSDITSSSEKSHIFRCHVGLTYFVIRLPLFSVISDPILCSEFDINNYIQYAEEFCSPTDEGLKLIDKLRSKRLVKQSQLQLAVDLIESLLEPLESNLSNPVFNYTDNKKIVETPPKIEPLINKLNVVSPPPTILHPHKIAGRRAVITGIGVVSPIGIGNEAFLEGIIAGKNGIHRITSFDPSDLPSQMAGEVNDFIPSKYMDQKTISHTSRVSHLAIAATQMAFEDAQLILEEEDSNKISVILGTGANGMEFMADQCYLYLKKGIKHLNPYSGAILFAGACSGAISMKFGLNGLSHTISTGCTSGSDAIGCSLRFIRSGETDIIVTGGSEASITSLTVSAFASLKALSKRNETPEEASRPFDKERDGFVLGEGAAIFILEELNHAIARNAHIYAEVLGYGATSDAYHIVRPAPDGVIASRAIYLALGEANLSPLDVEYVNAHGSSTPLNDKTETMISRMVFGKHAFSDKFAISSTKSQIGHALGAASTIGLAASLLGMEHGFLPPTINYKVFDPECDLNYVPNTPQYRQIQFFLSNAFAFTGKNSCLVLGKFLGI